MAIISSDRIYLFLQLDNEVKENLPGIGMLEPEFHRVHSM